MHKYSKLRNLKAIYALSVCRTIKSKKNTIKKISQGNLLHILTKIYRHCGTADENKKEKFHSCMGLRFKT
jgi:hypothetical protein